VIIGEYLEVRARAVVEVLSQNFPGISEENHATVFQDSQQVNRDLNRAPLNTRIKL
jgi:hypothetical protein